MSARLLSEEPTHYVMHDGTASFRVPKNGLSEGMHQRIRSMGEPQKMAEGGPISIEPGGGPALFQQGRPELPVSAFSFGAPSQQGPTEIPGVSGRGYGPDSIPIALPGAPQAAGDRRMSDLPLSAFSLAPPPGPAPLPQATRDRAVLVGPAQVGGPIPEIPGLRPKQATARPPTPGQNGAPAGMRPLGGAPKAPGMGGQAEMEAGQKESMASAEGVFEAEKSAARAKAEGLAEMGKVLERTQAERAQAQEMAKQQTSAAMQRVQAVQDEMNRIDTSVDPGRFWASRSTGDKILGTIGLVLGALGAGNDGVNRAAGILSQSIDRDLDAQKAEHELRLRKGAASVEGAKGFYAMARDAAGDELAASDLARSMALESAANKISQLEASTAEPGAKARLQAMRGQILQQSGENKAKAQQLLFENKLKTSSEARGWAELGIQQQSAAAKAAAGPKTPEAEQKLLAEVEEREQNIQRNSKELQALIKQYGTTEKLKPGIEERMNQLRSALIVDSAKLKDPGGVVREPDELREGKAMGFEPGTIPKTPLGAFTKLIGYDDDVALESLKSFAAGAAERKAEAFRARGLTPKGAK